MIGEKNPQIQDGSRLSCGARSGLGISWWNRLSIGSQWLHQRSIFRFDLYVESV